MIHLDHVQKYDGSLAELAEDIGNLRYDALADFLRALSDKIASDGAKDYARNRVKLAAHLQHCAEKVHEAAIDCDQAWRICEPFMRSDENK